MKIEGTFGVYENAGAPVGGTDEVQTFTLSAAPASGSFTLEFEGEKTAALAFDADETDVEAALNALGTIGASGVSVGLVGQVFTVTFDGGNMAKLAVPLIEVSANTLKDAGAADVDITVAEDTPGVTATARGAAKAALLLDTSTPDLYINAGTALAPVWKKITRAA